MMMKRMSKMLSLVLVLLMLLLAAGCGGSNGGDGQGDDGNGGGQTDGGSAGRTDLIFALASEPTSLDPKGSNDTVSFRVMYQIYDTLIREEADGSLVPGLAESWEVAEDGLSVSFTLRQDVPFHNGAIMTADDVEYSINQAIASSFTSRITNTMDRAEKVDDQTVVLYLKTQYEPILKCMAAVCMSIVNKDAMEADADDYARNPIGTGPYQFVEWRSGERLIFAAFPDYFRGEAAIKDLTYRFISDLNSSVVALENGEIDVLETFPKSARQSLMDNPNLNYYETESSLYYHISFNTESGVFSDARVREAISYAIDRDDLVLGALEGVGVPVEAPIPPSLVAYPDQFVGHGKDLDRARELLADAGYPDGFSVTMKTLEADIYRVPSEIIQDQLRQIGIDVELAIMERGAFLDDVYNSTNYEFTLANIVIQVPDADFAVFSRLHSSMLEGGNNIQQYVNPELDALIEQGRTTSDLEARKAIYAQIAEIVDTEAPLIPLMTDLNAIVTNKDLQGVRENAISRYIVYDYSWE